MDRLKSIQGLAYGLIILVLVVYVMIVGKVIVAPIGFAFLFAIMLSPVTSFLERLIKSPFASAIITILIGLAFVVGLIIVFSYQIVNVFENIPNISGRINEGVRLIFVWLQENWGVSRMQSEQWLQENFSNIADAPLRFLRRGITSSTSFIASAFVTLILVFFLLLYRKSFKNFLLVQSSKSKRANSSELLNKIQQTVRKYMYGTLLVMLILAIVNSTGLLIIGVDYAVFWGILAALLAIVPYIGTTLGGLLPFIYSIPTADYWWQPLAVVAFYATVQQIEGNVITPNIVGTSVKLNALVAILAILIGGIMWGIAGIILALPVTAILRLIFDHNDHLKTVAVLMGDNLHKHEDKFFDELDEDRFRISNWLK